jgi:DNA mismatch endonuclease (patch repair protein)
MTDKLTKRRRSENMRRIRSENMKPERAVRSIIHSLGYRFRLHARELPGRPDIVRRPQKQVIFVHGCYWHQHSLAACLDGRLPKSNREYWLPKLARNVQRDKASASALRRQGWKVLTVWECETKSLDKLTGKLRKFLAAK